MWLQQLDESGERRHYQPSTSVLQVSAITRDQSGVYTCHASNDAGNATVDVTVIVECKSTVLVFHFDTNHWVCRLRKAERKTAGEISSTTWDFATNPLTYYSCSSHVNYCIHVIGLQLKMSHLDFTVGVVPLSNSKPRPLSDLRVTLVLGFLDYQMLFTATSNWCHRAFH